MPKQKSSASSATRKKHAKKAVARQEAAATREKELEQLEEDGDDDVTVPDGEAAAGASAVGTETVKDAVITTDEQVNKANPSRQSQKGQQQQAKPPKKKQSKKHKKGEAPPPPRKKQYIPPPKPPRGQVDPVDIYGLGVTGTGYERVSAERVVTLRMLNKKDPNTVEKALEDISAWISGVSVESSEADIQEVVEAIPVWVHHLPRLLVHISRRVRLLSATIQAILIRNGPAGLLEATLPVLTSPVTLEHQDYLANQLVAAFDLDRQVRIVAVESWQLLAKSFTIGEYMQEILSSLTSTLLDPSYHAIGPSEYTRMSEEAKIAAQEEQDRKNGQVAASLDAFGYLSTYVTQEDAEAIETILSTDTFWAFLDPLATESTLVRRAAWRVSKCLLMSDSRPIQSALDFRLEESSARFLQIGFTERDHGTQNFMWDAIVVLVSRHPEVWEPIRPSRTRSKPHDTDSSSEDQNDSDDQDGQGKSTQALPTASSPILDLYMEMIGYGFFGNAVAGYKSLPTILSSVPESVLPRNGKSLETCMNHYWNAYTSRAFEIAGPSGVISFTAALPSVLEEFVSNDPSLPDKTALRQLQILWNFYLGVSTAPSRLLSLSTAATVLDLQRGLEVLLSRQASTVSEVTDFLFQAAERLIAGQSPRLDLLSAAINTLRQTDVVLLRNCAQNLERECLRAASPHIQSDNICTFFAALLGDHGHLLLQDADMRQILYEALPDVPLSSFALIERYLEIETEPSFVETVWTSCIRKVKQALSKTDFKTVLPVTQFFSHEVARSLPNLLSNAIDSVVMQALKAYLLEGVELSADATSFFSLLVCQTYPFHSQDLPNLVLAHLLDEMEDMHQTLLFGHVVAKEPYIFDKCLAILKDVDSATISAIKAQQLPVIVLFKVAYLLPYIIPPKAGSRIEAHQIWSNANDTMAPQMQQDSATAIASELNSYLLRSDTTISPLALVDAIRVLETSFTVNKEDLWAAFLPDKRHMQEMALLVLYDNFSTAFPTSLNLDRLQIESSNSRKTSCWDQYIRAVLAWMSIISSNRSFGATNTWMILHTTLLIILSEVEGLLAVQSQVQSKDLQALSLLADRITRYLVACLCSSLDASWHSKAIKSVKSEEQSLDIATALVQESLGLLNGKEQQTLGAYRLVSQILSTILTHTDTGMTEAEQWLGLAKGFQNRNFLVCLTICRCIEPFCQDSPRLRQYRSEIASTITGLKEHELGDNGVNLLRLFSALSTYATEELLPVNRAVFLVQHLQRQLTSDSEDFVLSEDLQSTALQAFAQLVTTVQNVSGSHWSFFFDLAESNIEAYSASDPATNEGFYMACEFLREVQDCASHNREFRQAVSKTLDSTVAALIGCMVQNVASLSNQPSLLQASLAVIQRQNVKSPSEQQLEASLQLLQTPRSDLRNSVFRTCQSLVRAKTEKLVLEVETATDLEEADNRTSIVLPQTLLDMLTSNAKDERTSSTVLLAWLLVCDHFTDTTQTIKSAYLDQLRRSGVVASSLLPSVVKMSSMVGRDQVVDFACWQVDDFFVEDLDDGLHPQSAYCLAAFVFFRALQTFPSLIRNEWEGIRDKQTSVSIATFTSRFFSPILIADQLARVQDGTISEGPEDESMTVKVLPAVNEVKATYIVDEQPMEISVRIPPNFPLTGVEVKEGKKIGVSEAIWRAWILNVQLVVTSQNGSIADAMALFKANASRHFEGVEACAICYSVISVTDRSLPSKRCRTCKNLFHPSCLYKWFSTSHGSTCPLCRSLF